MGVLVDQAKGVHRVSSILICYIIIYIYIYIITTALHCISVEGGCELFCWCDILITSYVLTIVSEICMKLFLCTGLCHIN